MAEPTASDREKADYIVQINAGEHHPLFQESLSEWIASALAAVRAETVEQYREALQTERRRLAQRVAGWSSEPRASAIFQGRHIAEELSRGNDFFERALASPGDNNV